MESFDNYISSSNYLLINPSFLDDKFHKEEALGYLPADTGIEIECDVESTYNCAIWDAIPNLVENNSSSDEQRLRIPSGMEGFKALWQICETLNNGTFIKSSSGIHYHIDIRHCYDQVIDTLSDTTKEIILKELDTWGYKGSYNSRNVYIDTRAWVRIQSYFKTMEIRIGEMAFDYATLSKRIVHGHYIVKKFLIEGLKLEYESYLEKVELVKEVENSLINQCPDIVRNKLIEIEV